MAWIEGSKVRASGWSAGVRGRWLDVLHVHHVPGRAGLNFDGFHLLVRGRHDRNGDHTAETQDQFLSPRLIAIRLLCLPWCATQQDARFYGSNGRGCRLGRAATDRREVWCRVWCSDSEALSHGGVAHEATMRDSGLHQLCLVISHLSNIYDTWNCWRKVV